MSITLRIAGIIGIILAIIAVLIGFIKMLKTFLIWMIIISVAALISGMLLKHLIRKNSGTDEENDEP
ncbi:MAG: hypothetical protein AB2L14_21065 [Candidatus Xenobiia bacterium LiM19]